MSLNQPVCRIAIVGTGVIGASWAAYYLARGIDVVATDPGPQAEANLRKYVDDAWPLLTEVGLSPGASRDRLTFSPLVEVVGGAKTSDHTIERAMAFYAGVGVAEAAFGGEPMSASHLRGQ